MTPEPRTKIGVCKVLATLVDNRLFLASSTNFPPFPPTFPHFPYWSFFHVLNLI